MGKEKGGFLTPKAIANRIKSKGLQKLRWFCQMCNKQCRDENGFKCHLTSESHQRQLLLVAETPEKFVDSFSRQFADDFLELLRRRFGTKRVHANVVYQDWTNLASSVRRQNSSTTCYESSSLDLSSACSWIALLEHYGTHNSSLKIYISDREHTHMNSTEWETLTDFVKWLGRESRCDVDETEKGWFIAYISRDPETIRKMEAATKKEKMLKDDDERRAQFIQGQIERARDGSAIDSVATPTNLNRIDSDEKIALKLVPTTSSTSANTGSRPASMLKNVLRIESEKAAERLRREDTLSTASGTTSKSNKSGTGVKRKSALEEIMEAEARTKEKRAKMDSWLFEGIVVKIIESRLGDEVYRKKGIVREIIDHQRAVVELIDSAKRLKLEQSQLETVLPAIGRPVLIVNGVHRGSEAVLVSIDEATFSCSVRLVDGSKRGGRVIDRVLYEDVSKLM